MLTVLLKILFKCGLFVGGQNDTFAHPQTFLGGQLPPLAPPAITPLLADFLDQCFQNLLIIFMYLLLFISSTEYNY